MRCERNPPPEIDKTAFDTPSGPHFRSMDLLVSLTAIQAYEDAGWKEDFGFVTITAGITTIDGIKYGIIDTPNEATLIQNTGNPYNLTIPSTVDIDGVTCDVTAIGDKALPDVGTLPLLTLIIPETMKSIGAEAFYNSSLKQVMVQANDPPALDSTAFEYPHRTEIDLIVPEGREQAYKDAGWTGFRDIFSLIGQLHRDSRGWTWEVTSLIPNEVSLVGYPYGGGDVEIPSEIGYLANSELDNMYTVTSIGKDAFKGKGLTSVLIPTTVDSIAVGTFQDNQLTSIEIPDAVTYIGSSAFGNNNLNGEVTIPDKVTSIGDFAFAHNNLEKVTIPNGVTDIGDSAFRDNQLTSITTPSNVNRIRSWTYASNQLTEVTISDSVTNIDLYAFLDNPDLHFVTVEAKTPPNLHKDAFSNAYRDQIDLVVPTDTKQTYLDNGWDGFRSISYGIFTVDNIKYAITSVGEVMAVDYTGMATEITMPETVNNGTNIYTVTTIVEGAFQNKELTSIEIPTSVTSIGQRAFSDNKLTAVTIPGSVERIDSHAFYNNPDLVLVTVEANDPPVLHATA
ncbi:leucine-rich repeat domain-containing protein, partial [Aquimarina gracilis]